MSNETTEADCMSADDGAYMVDEHAQEDTITHEVVINGDVVFKGTRKACWAFKRLNGGLVQDVDTEFDAENWGREIRDLYED